MKAKPKQGKQTGRARSHTWHVRVPEVTACGLSSLTDGLIIARGTRPTCVLCRRAGERGRRAT